MNHFSPFEQLTRESSYLYLNQTFVPGVQSMDLTNPYNNTPLNYIGQKRYTTVINRNQFSQLNIQSKIIGYDKLFQYTGVNLVNGYIFKDKQNPNLGIQCISGAMVSYNQTCAVGQSPECSTQFEFYGNVGTLNLIPRASNIEPAKVAIINSQLINIRRDENNETDDSIRISGPGSIEISTSQEHRSLRILNTNSVISYSFDLQLDRRPNFGLGATIYPFSVDLKRPTAFSAQFELDLSEITLTDIQDFYGSKEITDLTITLKDHLTNIPINQYRFNRIELNSERSQFNEGSNARAVIEFGGSIF